MAETAESVVIALEAQTQAYKDAINGAAGTTEGAMSRVEKSASQAEGAIQRSARSQIEAQQSAAAATASGAAATDAAVQRITNALMSQAKASGASAEQVSAAAAATAAAADRSAASVTAAATASSQAAEATSQGSAANDDYAQSHRKVEEASGRSSVAQVVLQSAVRKTVDQFVAGAPIATIFAEHLETFAEILQLYSAGQAGKAAEATEEVGASLTETAKDAKETGESVAEMAEKFTSLGGRVGQLAEFLAGPWGIALTAAVSILSVFGAKLLEGGDSVEAETAKLEENAKKVALAEQAKKAFANSEAGVIEDVRQLTDAIEKQNDALKTNAELANIRAKRDVSKLEADRDKLLKELASARANQSAAAGIAIGGTAGFNTAEGQAAAKVADISARLADVEKNIAGAKTALLQSRADLADEAAKRAADPVEQIKRLYEGPDGLIEQAKKRAIAEGVVGTALTRQLATLRDQEKAKIEAAQRDKREADSTNQIGRTINEAQARAIVESVGGTVTSGYRSTAKQAQLYADYKAGRGSLAAPPGSSLHEVGQAVDVAKTTGVTLKKLVDAFKAQGVEVREALDEGNHYHIGFGPKGKSDDQVANEANAQNQKLIADDKAFADQKASLNADIIASRRSEAHDVSLAATFARQQLDTDTKKRLADADSAEHAVLDDRNASAARKAQATAHAAILRGLIQERDAVKRGAINADETTALAADALSKTRAELGNREDLAQAAEALAETTTDRKNIELQLLDLKYQELRLEQQAIINSQTSTKTQKDIARARLGVLETLQASETARVGQQYRGSYETYRKQVAGDFESVQEAVDGIKVDALQRLDETLTNAAVSALGLKGALGEVIGQIIKIGIERRVIGPVADALFGKADGSSSGGLGGLLTSLIGGLSGGHSEDPAHLLLPKFAAGGAIQIGGRAGIDQNLLSLNGQPVAMVNRGETLNVVPANARAALPDSGARHFHIAVDARNSVTPAGFAQELASTILAQADQMDQQRQGATLRAAPASVQRAQRFGGG